MKPYRLLPPPPRERFILDEREGDDDLVEADLFDDDDLFACDVDGLLDGDVEALLDEEALLDVEALLDDEAPLLVRPDCDVAGLVDARLEAVFPDPRPACDVEGRVPPLPAVLKLPLFILLFTRLEVFLLLLL